MYLFGSKEWFGDGCQTFEKLETPDNKNGKFQVQSTQKNRSIIFIITNFENGWALKI